MRHATRPQDVLYVESEAILPDDSLNDWVVESVRNGLGAGARTAAG